MAKKQVKKSNKVKVAMIGAPDWNFPNKISDALLGLSGCLVSTIRNDLIDKTVLRYVTRLNFEHERILPDTELSPADSYTKAVLGVIEGSDFAIVFKKQKDKRFSVIRNTLTTHNVPYIVVSP